MAQPPSSGPPTVDLFSVGRPCAIVGTSTDAARGTALRIAEGCPLRSAPPRGLPAPRHVTRGRGGPMSDQRPRGEAGRRSAFHPAAAVGATGTQLRGAPAMARQERQPTVRSRRRDAGEVLRSARAERAGDAPAPKRAEGGGLTWPKHRAWRSVDKPADGEKAPRRDRSQPSRAPRRRLQPPSKPAASPEPAEDRSRDQLLQRAARRARARSGSGPAPADRSLRD